MAAKKAASFMARSETALRDVNMTPGPLPRSLRNFQTQMDHMLALVEVNL